ncbi:MAG TPA: DUF4136 domain-containing protein [Novosphingobium sp.]|nr:DUF4136 domain-containing protein [Novosphingobium sp.]
MTTRRCAALALSLGTALMATPGLAQPGPWGDRGWGHEPIERGGYRSRTAPRDGTREGKVEVARFIAEGTPAEALGHGAVIVRAAPAIEGRPAPLDDRERATYEAAVIDQLARSGYQTADLSTEGGQVAELRVVHDVVVPEEAPHKSVSGAMEAGVSNHGSMLGMAIDVDLSKPARALVGTRLELRIRDRATGAVLWEGRADITTREGSSRWTDQAIATRLAEALFDKFPGRSGETVALK